MRTANRNSESSLAGVLLRILWVVLVIFGLNLAPQAQGLTEGLRAARQALDDSAPQAALRHLDWVLAHEPWRGPDLWRLVGQTALEAGNLQAASQALLLLAQGGHATAADWLAIGNVSWQLSQYTQALGYWQQAVDAAVSGAAPIDPGLQAARKIVETYRARSQSAAEITALRQVLSLYPSAADYLRLGLLLIVNNPREALTVFEAAADIVGEESQTPQTSSAARLEAGVRAALLFDEPAYINLQCGRLLGTEGYWDFAYVAFYEAARLRPDVAEAWAFLAEANQQMTLQGVQSGVDSGVTRRWLEQAHQLEPENLVVNVLSGLYWLRQDQPEQALPFLYQAAKLDPRNPLWQQSIGAALAGTGDFHAAQVAYRQATAASPSSADAWRVLAEFYLHYEIELETQGLPAAQRAMTLDPKNPANQDAVGLALLLLGRGTEAEAFFLAAVALDPNYAPALLHLGGVYLDRGQKEAAAEYLARAEALAGDHPADFFVPADVRRLQAWLNQSALLFLEP